MDAVSTLLLGAVADGGPQTNESGLALLLLRFDHRVVDALKIATVMVSERSLAPQADLLVTVVYMEDLPAI